MFREVDEAGPSYLHWIWGFGFAATCFVQYLRAMGEGGGRKSQEEEMKLRMAHSRV